MRTVMKIVALRSFHWACERVLEVALVTALLMIADRPAQHVGNGGLVEEILRTSTFPIAFYFFGFYLLSCLIFGYILRPRRRVFLAPVMAIAFAAHYWAAFYPTGAFSDPEAMAFFYASIGIVFFVHLLPIGGFVERYR